MHKETPKKIKEAHYRYSLITLDNKIHWIAIQVETCMLQLTKEDDNLHPLNLLKNLQDKAKKR